MVVLSCAMFGPERERIVSLSTGVRVSIGNFDAFMLNIRHFFDGKHRFTPMPSVLGVHDALNGSRPLSSFYGGGHDQMIRTSTAYCKFKPSVDQRHAQMPLLAQFRSEKLELICQLFSIWQPH